LTFPFPGVQSPPIAAEFSSGITMNDGTDYRAILASDTPLIDVRAPIEFAQGAMPAAIPPHSTCP
jgi:hypothetical protein